MMPIPLPDADVLISLLRYDACSGTLYWRVRGGNAPHTKSFNSRFAGKPALNRVGANGYRMGCLNGRYICAHRVIWKMATGVDPEVIDHIDGDKTNNMLNNLRSVTQALNSRNTARRSDNASGVTGVSWLKRDRRWAAEIRVDGKRLSLGHFTNFEDAVAARRNAAAKHGFSSRHGEPA